METQALLRDAAPADQTRLALIRSAVFLFGRDGFGVTSTRAIASRAKANVGSIAYHFGSKEGLRDACANYVVATIRSVAGGVLDAPPPALPADRAAAEAMLLAAAERMVGFIVARPEVDEFVQFILREVAQPTTAFDIIYGGVFEPVHIRLCRLWAASTGEGEDDELTKITVFTMVGQVIYFKVARTAVLRRLGWSTIGASESSAVTAVAVDNLRAVVRSRREARRSQSD